jgi:hypothetical protein
MNNAKLSASRPIASAAALALALSGCASVHIVKVTGDPQPEGIPFYLPRPYVQVFEPFVIGSQAWLVSGDVSPDGQYLLIDDAGGKAALGERFQGVPGDGRKAKISVNVIRPPAPGQAPDAGNRAMTPSNGSADGQKEAGTAEDAPGAGAPVDPQKPGGMFKVTVASASSPFPPTLGRRFFDVVWMPDFDEKYVVQGRPGLGNASIGVTLTQGWGLYGLDADIDNSALTKPLLDFYSKSLDALGQLASSKILPAGALVTATTPNGERIAGNSGDVVQLAPGAQVTVKITRVQVVAPGLYPILKPGEKAAVADPESANPDLVKRHLPIRPYTNIAFDTYEVMVVEATKPSGDTPMNLQHYFDGAIPAPASSDGKQ